MRSARRLTIAVIVLCTLFAVGNAATGYWLREIRPFEETDNAYVRSHLAHISPEIPGYVQAIHFTDHQRVRKGALLVVLDDREYRARVAHAKAALAAARARLLTLQADIAVQDARVAQREADIRSVDAEVRRAGRDRRASGNWSATVPPQVRPRTLPLPHMPAPERAGNRSGLHSMKPRVNDWPCRHG